MTTLIGIVGNIGSGKTSTASILKQYGFQEYSFADPLKQIGKIFKFSDKQLYGTQEDKLEIHPYWGVSSREFLQKLGTDVFRDFVPTILPSFQDPWVKLFIYSYSNERKNTVISDVRFQSEAKVIKELGGILIRTKRDNKIVSEGKKETIHASEQEINSIVCDYEIDNNLLTFDMVEEKLKEIIHPTPDVLYKNVINRMNKTNDVNIRRQIMYDFLKQDSKLSVQCGTNLGVDYCIILPTTNNTDKTPIVLRFDFFDLTFNRTTNYYDSHIPETFSEFCNYIFKG